jgi:aminopeptidase N
MRHLCRVVIPLLLLIFPALLPAQVGKRSAEATVEGKRFDWEFYPGETGRLELTKPSLSAGRLLGYELDLDFRSGLTNNTPFFSGRDRVAWRPAGDSVIVLDAINLRIDSVKNANLFLNFDNSSTFGKLKIVLPLALRNYDSLLVDIWYAHTSSLNVGYYYYDKNVSGGTLERIGYTFTEPYDSPYWFPCVNDPSVKVPCKARVTVPSGYLAASNGLLKQTATNGDGSVTFQWEETHPIAMYLISVTISKYSTFSHYYRRVANPIDSIEIKYYIWQADSAGPTYNAVTAFRNVVDMVSFYSTIFGEYPFDKYGMAAVYPFGAGGMEHQTITTIHRSWLANGGAQSGIAHELAHSWWGDMVTCATWADIWLNEGFATYSEALWAEHLNGSNGLKSYMESKKNFGAASWQYPIYNPPPNFLFGDLVYGKAAWVLHMLRYIVGDALFLDVLHTYRQRYEYKSATTAQFAAAASDVAGRDLSWFFNQWIYRKGWPVYAYIWSVQPRTGGGFDLNVSIQQQQSEDVFQMPIQLRAATAGKDTLLVADNTTRTQSFQFVLPFQPDSLIFDPSNWILKQMSSNFTGVHNGEGLPASFTLFQNYPNPFNAGTVIRYSSPVEGQVTLGIYDVLGREVMRLVNGVQPAGIYEARFEPQTLTSGVYFYRLSVSPTTSSNSGFVETKKMILMK